MKINSVEVSVSIDREIVSPSAKQIMDYLVESELICPTGDFTFIINATSLKKARITISTIAALEEIQKNEDEGYR